MLGFVYCGRGTLLTTDSAAPHKAQNGKTHDTSHASHGAMLRNADMERVDIRKLFP